MTPLTISCSKQSDIIPAHTKSVDEAFQPYDQEISCLIKIQVYAPDGTRLGKIPVPGLEGAHLLIALGKSLYAINLNTRGAQQP